MISQQEWKRLPLFKWPQHWFTCCHFNSFIILLNANKNVFCLCMFVKRWVWFLWRLPFYNYKFISWYFVVQWGRIIHPYIWFIEMNVNQFISSFRLRGSEALSRKRMSSPNGRTLNLCCWARGKRFPKLYIVILTMNTTNRIMDCLYIKTEHLCYDKSKHKILCCLKETFKAWLLFQPEKNERKPIREQYPLIYIAFHNFIK